MTGPNRDLLTLLTFWTRSKRDLAVLRGDATWRTRASRELRLIVILVLFYFQCLIFYEVEKMFLLLWLYFLRPPSFSGSTRPRGGFDWRLFFEGFIENFISNLLTASPSTTFTRGGFSNGRPGYPVLWLIFSIFTAHTWLSSGYWIFDELLIEFHFQFACKFHCLWRFGLRPGTLLFANELYRVSNVTHSTKNFLYSWLTCLCKNTMFTQARHYSEWMSGVRPESRLAILPACSFKVHYCKTT